MKKYVFKINPNYAQKKNSSSILEAFKLYLRENWQEILIFLHTVVISNFQNKIPHAEEGNSHFSNLVEARYRIRYFS